MTGAELAAIRKAAGLSQSALAQRVGIGRHAVSYWERKPDVDLRSWAVRRMAEALPLPDYCTRYARAGGWGVSPFAALDAMVDRKLADAKARAARRAARLRVRCGARTRKGSKCRNLSEPGKRRCKFHGGKSTGPRTHEGREKIAEAQRRRWARWRFACSTVEDPLSQHAL